MSKLPRVQMSLDELLNLPAAVDLVTAARALGIGRTKAFALVHAREFPCRVLRVGSAYRIPTADLFELLGVSPSPAASSAEEWAVAVEGLAKAAASASSKTKELATAFDEHAERRSGLTP